MHPDNTFYGHRRILARHCGIAERPIAGHLQHGWRPDAGYSQYRRRLVPWLAKLVWSEHNARQAREEGARRVERVGAPWCYLMRDRGVPALPPMPATLFFPAHGFERHAVDRDDDLLHAALTEREHAPVTVCLYWTDYDNPRVRRRWEDRGYPVVTNGHRSNPNFLETMYANIERHDRVVSNHVGTPVFYGAHAGRQVEVYGPRASIPGEADPVEREAAERRRWPALCGGGIQDAEHAVALATRELGEVLDPDALAAALGWDHEAGLRERALGTAARLDHHVRRLAVNAGKAGRLPGWR